jgi:chromate transporter
MSTARPSLVELFRVFLRLGLTSFGGPVAHLGFFHDEFVVRRRWLSETAYADLVTLCQFLPGPASSQVVMGIGLGRAGVPGALVASLGFTLPSIVLMVAFGYGLLHLGGDLGGAGWIRALKLVAVAVVAQAVWGMARGLCPDRSRRTLAVVTATVLVVWPGSWTQLAAILVGGLIGWRALRVDVPAASTGLSPGLGRGTALALLALFFVLFALALLPIDRVDLPVLELAAAMYQSGALVFGGGHVVLPLLEAETVRTGLVDADTFLAGYGAAQALPGPLFTFAAFLGTVQTGEPAGWVGGMVATVAIFLPAFLLTFGVLPFWAELRRYPAARSALAGVNAAVVGLLLAALYDPVFTAAVDGATDLALVLVAFALLVFWKLPVWLLVVGAGTAGAVLGMV